MARALLSYVVTDSDGDVQASAAVTVYESDGVTPVGQTMYTAASGGVALSNPLTTNSSGLIQAYFDTAQTVILSYGTGPTTRTVYLTPDPTTLSRITDVETLTNKTLTNPTINAATITGAITVTGNATFSNQLLAPDGVAATPGYGFSGQAGVGIIRSASNKLGLVTSSTEQVSVDSAGALLLKSLSGTPSQNGGYHQGLAKAWAIFDNAGSIAGSANVTGVTDTGTGDWLVAWTRAFASTAYVVLPAVEGAYVGTAATAANVMIQQGSKTTGVAQVLCQKLSDGSALDVTAISVVAFGVQ